MPHSFVSIAPLFGISNFHFNYFCRLLTSTSVLYTEMLVDRMLLHADAPHRGLRLRTLPHHHPIVAQLGGSDAAELCAAARFCEEAGFTGVNLNVGCPSQRVSCEGQFGARLMLDRRLPDTLKAMRSSLRPETELSVKHRIGVDDHDSYEFFHDFVKQCHEVGGVNSFVVHARKAHLNGLSTKQNRTVPPLQYEHVFRLKQALPHLRIVINGGINTIEQIRSMIGLVDGVMIGRASYENPYLMRAFDEINYEVDPLLAPITTSAFRQSSRPEVARAYASFLATELASAAATAATPSGSISNRSAPHTNVMLRPLNDLFHEQRGARKWRHALASRDKSMDIENVVRLALDEVERA